MRIFLTNLDACEFYATDVVNAKGEMIRIRIPPLTTAEVVNIDPFFLNQDKNLRNAIFRDGRLGYSFAAEPDDLIGLPGGGVGSGFNRTDQRLITTANPRVFRTAEYFVHLPGVDPIQPVFSIEVFHNGKRERQTKTTSPSDGDYVVEESGGVGTGYDTVRFLTFTPKPASELRANYQAV